MAWFLFRRSGRLRPGFEDVTADAVRELLSRILEDSARQPRSLRASVPACARCGRIVRGSLNPGGLCEECFTGAAARGSSRPSTAPCGRCGMRFSENLMSYGLCHSCRTSYGADSQDERRGEPGHRSLPSDSALRDAYEILGCDETASDETIKGLYRRLAKECHADRLPREAPGERVRDANERFHRLREAYEKIMGSRKQPG